jgi:penicillin V acylase-like amidase (Ntn superfamily)
MPLPGNVNPRDRFARASYFLSMMPTPKTEREGVAGLFAIARNVSVPFGTPYKTFGIYNTEYRSVTDDTNRRYFFELTTSPNDDIELSGDVTPKFERAATPF